MHCNIQPVCLLGMSCTLHPPLDMLSFVLLLLALLQVASEDTVLFTAEQYCQQLESDVAQQASQQALAQLVRCPHLSLYWLTAPMVASNNDTPAAWAGAAAAKAAGYASASPHHDSAVHCVDLKKFILDAPSSWHLQKRAVHPVDAVAITWALDVSSISSSARQCAAEQGDIALIAPRFSQLFRSIAWRPRIVFYWDAAARMVKVGAGAVPENLCAGMFCRFKNRMSCVGVRSATVSPMLDSEQASVCRDFFQVGPMAGGWDDDAWGTEGLAQQRGSDLKAGSFCSRLNVRIQPSCL